MLTKQQSPEQAMANVEQRWNQITERLGRRSRRKWSGELQGVPEEGRYGPNAPIK